MSKLLSEEELAALEKWLSRRNVAPLLVTIRALQSRLAGLKQAGWRDVPDVRDLYRLSNRLLTDPALAAGLSLASTTEAWFGRLDAWVTRLKDGGNDGPTLQCQDCERPLTREVLEAHWVCLHCRRDQLMAEAPD